MSPNQPKTPVSTFRLSEETKAQLRGAAELMEVTMTEAVRRSVESLSRLNAAMNNALPDQARRMKLEERRQRSEEAVAALAAYLIDRDWPSAQPRERGGSRGYEYATRAAAILNGEAWAIRKTWPEAASEIATRSDWG